MLISAIENSRWLNGRFLFGAWKSGMRLLYLRFQLPLPRYRQLDSHLSPHWLFLLQRAMNHAFAGVGRRRRVDGASAVIGRF